MAVELSIGRQSIGAMASAILSVVCLLLLHLQVAAAQQDQNVGIIYGDNHVFSVKAPPSWILDNQSGVSQGLQAVFYPVGSSWKDSVAMMYVNTATRSGEKGSLARFISDEISDFKKESTELKVKDVGSFKTSDGKDAVVKELTGDKWGNSELVAYIEEEAVFVMLVLNSRKQTEFEKSRAAFKELVSSYKVLKAFDYFGLAQSIAKRQVATPEGKEYERLAMSEFGLRHADTMKRCFDTTANPDKQAFSAVMEIRSDGKVSKILLHPETNIALCLKESMKDDFYPRPPAENWWLTIDMKISN